MLLWCGVVGVVECGVVRCGGAAVEGQAPPAAAGCLVDDPSAPCTAPLHCGVWGSQPSRFHHSS